MLTIFSTVSSFNTTGSSDTVCSSTTSPSNVASTGFDEANLQISHSWSCSSCGSSSVVEIIDSVSSCSSWIFSKESILASSKVLSLFFSANSWNCSSANSTEFDNSFLSEKTSL